MDFPGKFARIIEAATIVRGLQFYGAGNLPIPLVIAE